MLRGIKNKRNIYKRSDKHIQGQVIIEFTMSMLIVLLMVFGMIMIMRWTGLDLLSRARSHQSVLLDDSVVHDYEIRTDGPMKQIDPFFYDPIPMNSVWVP